MSAVKVEPPKCDRENLHNIMAWAEGGRPMKCPFCDEWFVYEKPRPWWRFWA